MGWKKHVPNKSGHLQIGLKAILDEGWTLLDGDDKPARALIKGCRTATDDDIRKLSITTYQNGQLQDALSYVKNFDCAIDGGANYGFMSYHLNHFKQTHAFEMYPPVRECLEKNVKHFGLTNVIVHPYGLGEKAKNVEMRSKTTFGNHIHPNGEEGDGSMQIIPIDSLNLTACDFIKLDCEGYEPFIIQGAINTISKFKPVLLMEHGVKNNLSEKYYKVKSKDDHINLLIDMGYKILKQFKKDIIMGPTWL